MKSTLSGDSLPTGAIDTKPYIRYHPIIGYEYIPNTVMTLPTPDDGKYTIAINSAGIRSCREYSVERKPGGFRILVFGDSFAAGQYVSNENRFSEILERTSPGLEVMNFGLEGTGTDQQLLIFKDLGRRYEFDLILLVPFLQNIRRNMADSRVALDPQTGQPVLIRKPRFELNDGCLVLRQVPVPRERRPVEEASAEFLLRSDSDFSAKARFKTLLSRMAESWNLKKGVYSLLPREPFPEYKSASTPEWKLMEAIICRFIELAQGKPVVIVPLFYPSYVRYRMARNYWQRFHSLGDGRRSYVVDVLPHLKSLGSDAERCFHVNDCHLSVHGHLVLSNILRLELARLGLFPASVAGCHQLTVNR